MIHSFLLVGQSNMAGRGYEAERIAVDESYIKVLRNGYWKPMHRPINFDGSTARVCLAEHFAELYAKEHGVEVGLIPCAEGGTCIEQWREGSILFDHACYISELASRTSEIKGILWHQGESDCAPDKYPVYEEKLSVIIDAFRFKPYLKNVPFIMGELGEYLGSLNPSSDYDNYIYINQALHNLAKTKDKVGIVSSRGLTPNPDNLHFNAGSLYEFGMRYYKEYENFTDKYVYGLEEASYDRR